MRFYRCIFAGIIVTIAATSYVHQRVEIVKTGYDLQRNREHLSRLVDQNSKLMYNLLKLESPKSLLASLNNEKIEFAGLRAKQVKNRDYQLNHTDSNRGETVVSVVGRFLDLFAVDAEASPRE